MPTGMGETYPPFVPSDARRRRWAQVSERIEEVGATPARKERCRQIAMRGRTREEAGDERRDVSEEEGEHESSRSRKRKDLERNRMGVYVPPSKHPRPSEEEETDVEGESVQRRRWEELKRRIHRSVNKVNASNVKEVVVELLGANLLRGRGLLAKSMVQSQAASPGFTRVYAAVVAVINSKLPTVGETIVHRVVLQFRRAYRRNDKMLCLSTTKFLAHLVNQHVVHELLALEMLALMLEDPTEDSVEVASALVKEVGETLLELSPQGLNGVFERFRNILHEGKIGKRTQYNIENLFAARKANFEGYPAISKELDLLEEEDFITHEVSLDDELNPETAIDLFQMDPHFRENEAKYEAIRKEILGEEDEEVSEGTDGGDEVGLVTDQALHVTKTQTIQDETGTDAVNLRRTIYLTIMSSVDFEEAGHKLLKIGIPEGREIELCTMIVECCSQERTYLRYYGLLGERFAKLKRAYHDAFAELFAKQYEAIHRLETGKLRNVAKFFANLFASDALTWRVLSCIRLTEEDTTPSSRIFVKVLFLELSEILGLTQLNERLLDPSMQVDFAGIFPKDTPKNMRFSINFFTSIGLGGITDALREYLKNVPTAPLRAVSETSSETETSSSYSEENESLDRSYEKERDIHRYRREDNAVQSRREGRDGGSYRRSYSRSPEKHRRHNRYKSYSPRSPSQGCRHSPGREYDRGDGRRFEGPSRSRRYH